MATTDRRRGRLENQPLTEAIVSFAVETAPAAVPQSAMRSAKKLVLNTIGVALASANRQIGSKITRYAAEMGPSPATATILGGRLKVSPAMAALANGTMAHALALDSGHHITTHVIPAALAVVEHRRLSGRELLDAVAIGYEVGNRLTYALGNGFAERGWWHAGLVGPIDAAVTAGRLLRLNKRQVAIAIGIASCNSGGFRRSIGSMAQALHSGNAAHDGVQAAILAEMGFTADPAIIEAPLGFMSAVTQPEERDLDSILLRLGRPFILEQWPGITPYPGSAISTPLIDAVQLIRKAEKFLVDDVAEVEADLHFSSLYRCPPQSETEGGYCGAYVLAATLLHGEFGFAQITAEAVRDPRALALMQRVRHVPSQKPDFDRVVLRLRDGRKLSAEVQSVPRHFLYSDEDLMRMFHQCAERVLSKRAADELESLVLDLENLATIDRLMAVAGGSA